MVGSGGHGALTTQGSPYQKRVTPSLTQKENVDVGCLLPHRGVAIAGAALPKKEVCRASKVVYASSAGAKIVDAVAVVGTTDADADSDAVADCFARALPSDPQGAVLLCSVPFRSEMGDRKSSSRLAHGGVRMEFPLIFSGSCSSYVKAGLGMNSEVVLPAHASRVANATTADAISAVEVNADSSVTGGNLSVAAPSSSILVRSENSVQRSPISSFLDLGGGEFPPLRSVSGSRRSGKSGFGKGSDVPVAGMSSGDPRECLSMGGTVVCRGPLAQIGGLCSPAVPINNVNIVNVEYFHIWSLYIFCNLLLHNIIQVKCLTLYE